LEDRQAAWDGDPNRRETKEWTIKDHTADPHVTDSEIMRFLEGGLDEQDKARMRAHARVCSDCFDAYQDALIVHGLWTTDESVFEPTAELVKAGARIASPPAAKEEARKDAVPLGLRAGFRRYRRLAATAACAAAVLIVGLLWLRPDRIDRRTVAGFDPAMIAPVQRAIEAASVRGPFVLPGGEHVLDRAPSAYRSGFVTLSDSLAISLEQLERAFQKGNSSPEVACLLLGGYIATGQRVVARDLADHPRVSQASAECIMVLKALAAYMDGDRFESERLLRQVLAAHPDDGVAATDLAVVLIEKGETAEARTLLARVGEDHAHTPLASRANSILSNLQKE